jgi:hypothetical protein
MKIRNRLIALLVTPLISVATTSFAGGIPASVPGKSENPKCYTSSNASAKAKSAVTKNPLKTCQASDGLSEATAGTSAFQIKRDFPSSTDGIYWIKNSLINSGVPFKIYADMTTDGGGWTLIVANSINLWTYSEALLKNQDNPPTSLYDLSSQSGKYSILSYADSIKKSESGFQYRMDAVVPGTCGGVWTANSAYSFVSTSNLNTNVSRIQNWGGWPSDGNDGIEERMPYLSPDSQGLLTTSFDPNNEWWGTIIQSSNWESPNVTPWIAYLNQCARPGIIWYWVR